MKSTGAKKMSDLEILECLFNNEARVQTLIEYDKTFVELTEPQSDDSIVKIRDMPRDTFIIVADRFPSPDKVFTGGRGECKRADFIVISELRQCILYIELKKTKKENKHIAQQLTGAKCFVEYCKAIVEWFWENPSFLKNYEERYVYFRHTEKHVKKRPTRGDKNPTSHNTPYKAQIIDWVSSKGIQYNKLVGKFD